MIITVFIRSHQLSLASARKSSPRLPTLFLLRSFLILFSYLCLDLPNGLFPAKMLHAFLISSMSATCPAHLEFLELTTITVFGEKYKL